MKKSLIALSLLVAFAAPAFGEDKRFYTPYDDPYPALIKIVDDAKNQVLVGAYGFNNIELTDALVNALKRGVKVSLVVDKTQSSLKNQKAQLARLKDAGAYIHIGRSLKRQIMHAKFIVADEKVEADGSLNFTSKSQLQDNTVTISDDKARVAEFVEYWTKIDRDMD